MPKDETAAVAEALARLARSDRGEGADRLTAGRIVAALASAGFVVLPAAERDAYVARAHAAEAERDAAIRRWSQLSVDLHALVFRSAAFVAEAPATRPLDEGQAREEPPAP